MSTDFDSGDDFNEIFRLKCLGLRYCLPYLGLSRLKIRSNRAILKRHQRHDGHLHRHGIGEITCGLRLKAIE
jgi:hypothetical protein